MHRLATLLALFLLTAGLYGCDLIGDVLEFGFWTIVILIAIVVGIIWLIRGAIRGRTRDRTPPPPGA